MRPWNTTSCSTPHRVLSGQLINECHLLFGHHHGVIGPPMATIINRGRLTRLTTTPGVTDIPGIRTAPRRPGRD